MFVCVSLLTALLVFLVVSTVRHNRGAVTLAALGRGVILLSIVQLAYGAWVVMTGLTPGKHIVFEVPRTHSLNYFLWAAILALLGVGAIALDRRLRKSHRSS